MFLTLNTSLCMAANFNWLDSLFHTAFFHISINAFGVHQSWTIGEHDYCLDTLILSALDFAHKNWSTNWWLWTVTAQSQKNSNLLMQCKPVKLFFSGGEFHLNLYSSSSFNLRLLESPHVSVNPNFFNQLLMRPFFNDHSSIHYLFHQQLLTCWKTDQIR